MRCTHDFASRVYNTIDLAFVSGRDGARGVSPGTQSPNVKRRGALGETQGGGGCTHDLTCRNHHTIDLASLKCRDGASRVFAAELGSQSSSAKNRDLFG